MNSDTIPESAELPAASRQIDLAFSRKYDANLSKAYFEVHQDGFSRRLSHWRETAIARRALALAGNPLSVLDLPCGAGRFWPMLLENPERRLIAADNSQDMLDVALASQPEPLTRRVTALRTSAFAIDLPDGAVDCVFCIRLLHHIGDPAHRQAMLREFYRVAKDSLVISLWVDGNFKAWQRKRLEARRGHPKGYQNRFVISKSMIESEFYQAGFDVAGRVDFLPGYAMWRTYALKKRAAG